MTDNTNIPVLTDLIEKGVEIELSELGLDQDPSTGKDAVANTLADNPALEQEIRRILDEHMELAWQEIRIAIQEAGSKSSSD
jgi:hypothetical protein